MRCQWRVFGEAAKCASERARTAIAFEVCITATSHLLRKQGSGNSKLLFFWIIYDSVTAYSFGRVWFWPCGETPLRKLKLCSTLSIEYLQECRFKPYNSLKVCRLTRNHVCQSCAPGHDNGFSFKRNVRMTKWTILYFDMQVETDANRDTVGYSCSKMGHLVSPRYCYLCQFMLGATVGGSVIMGRGGESSLSKGGCGARSPRSWTTNTLKNVLYERLSEENVDQEMSLMGSDAADSISCTTTRAFSAASTKTLCNTFPP